MARDLRVSERRLLGWEPTETHEHVYDDAGRLVRTTVTREPEWDDEQRSLMLALQEYEAGICSCGFHRSLTMDTANGFTTSVEVCPVCAGAELSGRMRAKSDEETARILKDRPHEPRPSDGRHVYIRQLTADELEKRRARGGSRGNSH